MKLSHALIITALLLAYGFLPVTIPYYSGNYSNPNTLLISRQECGCPCAEGKIVKGRLHFSDSIKKAFPNLDESVREFTLKNFPPFNKINSGKLETLDFANNNDFKVTGKVIGVDTILCTPSNCEIVPKFEVSSWTLTTYYPRFQKFNYLFRILYFGVLLIGITFIAIKISLVWKKSSR